VLFMYTVTMDRHDDGEIKTVYHLKGEKLHREGNPAVIRYYVSGNTKYVKYYRDGQLHRDSLDGPAIISYDEYGRKILEEYYECDLLHRTNGPARVEYNKDGGISSENYFKDGVPYREDGPTTIERMGIYIHEFYRNQNNKPHRIDGPSNIIRRKDGTIKGACYHINGLRHRVDGPALYTYDDFGNISHEEWYYNDVKMDPFQILILSGCE
jgi:antitoxin component YwqK of YwqJK toxin-antitoxin module